MKKYSTSQISRRVVGVLGVMVLFVGFGMAAQSAAAQSIDPVLTQAEIADLQYMREEEKMAHDVYVNLGALWGLPLFNNIAAAEQTHATAVLNLLDYYGIADPAAGNGVGVFTNPELQALYNQLLSQGSVSMADALLVGGLIEETDIQDLQTSLVQTQQANIQLVYQNLLAGSSNHLRAFASRYEQLTGQTYEPQVLDQATFDAIMAGSAGQGNGRRLGQDNGSNGNNGNNGGIAGNGGGQRHGR